MQLLPYQQETKMVLLVAFKQHEHRAIREELSILMQKGFSRMFLMKQGEAGNARKD
jgi:excinuclease ABC subunit A